MIFKLSWYKILYVTGVKVIFTSFDFGLIR